MPSAGRHRRELLSGATPRTEGSLQGTPVAASDLSQGTAGTRTEMKRSRRGAEKAMKPGGTERGPGPARGRVSPRPCLSLQSRAAGGGAQQAWRVRPAPPGPIAWEKVGGAPAAPRGRGGQDGGNGGARLTRRCPFPVPGRSPPLPAPRRGIAGRSHRTETEQGCGRGPQAAAQRPPPAPSRPPGHLPATPARGCVREERPLKEGRVSRPPAQSFTWPARRAAAAASPPLPPPPPPFGGNFCFCFSFLFFFFPSFFFFFFFSFNSLRLPLPSPLGRTGSPSRRREGRAQDVGSVRSGYCRLLSAASSLPLPPVPPPVLPPVPPPLRPRCRFAPRHPHLPPAPPRGSSAPAALGAVEAGGEQGTRAQDGGGGGGAGRPSGGERRQPAARRGRGLRAPLPPRAGTARPSPVPSHTEREAPGGRW
ncbi:basic salivary proline-rich protein 4-like [Anomalospiza imberbis]|uniref:basic salivary proline-rich protein 4-like n=1 Tax=Anomalospiza imberbis TaxID=187417 RepID=UPI00358E61D7